MRKMNIYSYILPIDKEIFFMKKREGYVIELIDEETGWGEVATSEDLVKEIKTVGQLFLKDPQTALEIKMSPALSFGFQMAQMKEKIAAKPLPIAALLWTEDFAYAKRAYQMGCRTFKVKVSHLAVDDAVAYIQKLRKEYPDVSLRIDANQKWRLPDAIFFSSHFEPTDFAYLEEPLASFSDLFSFSELTSFPVAVDESIYKIPLEEIFELPTLKAFVVKPTLFGGPIECEALCKKLRKRDIDFVISPYFESGLGTLALARLGQMLGVKSAVGVDTYRFLQEDILEDRLTFAEGCIHYQEAKINRKKLCPLFSVP